MISFNFGGHVGVSKMRQGSVVKGMKVIVEILMSCSTESIVSRCICGHPFCCGFWLSFCFATTTVVSIRCVSGCIMDRRKNKWKMNLQKSHYSWLWAGQYQQVSSRSKGHLWGWGCSRGRKGNRSLLRRTLVPTGLFAKICAARDDPSAI